MTPVTKKTFYYNFVPSKAQEEASKARNVPYQVSRVLVEVNDIQFPLSQIHDIKLNPWPIRKSLGSREMEIVADKIELSHNEAFDHVFRYWPLEIVNSIVMQGRKFSVAIVDFTDEKNPRRYQGEHIYLEKEKGPNENYNLRWIDLARTLPFHAGDEIGLLWDSRSGCFHFKLLNRGA